MYDPSVRFHGTWENFKGGIFVIITVLFDKQIIFAILADMFDTIAKIRI